MWHLVQNLSEQTIYKGNQIEVQSVRFKIRNIYTGHSNLRKSKVIYNRFQGGRREPPPDREKKNQIESLVE